MGLESCIIIIILVCISAKQYNFVRTCAWTKNHIDYCKQSLSINFSEIFEYLRIRHKLDNIVHIASPFCLFDFTLRVFTAVDKEIY
jgi:hypothetical protein